MSQEMEQWEERTKALHDAISKKGSLVGPPPGQKGVRLAAHQSLSLETGKVEAELAAWCATEEAEKELVLNWFCEVFGYNPEDGVCGQCGAAQGERLYRED